MTRDVDGTAAIRTSDAAPRAAGRYRILAEQGTSAFGTVYLAEDSETGNPVAVRLLPREIMDVEGVAQTLHRRAPAVVEASRAHPSLVAVLEYGTLQDGSVFAVMERPEGRRLSQLLAESGKPEVAAALRMALELGGAAETLSNMGFVHGALRPSNVVVGEDGTPKLLDVELVALRDEPALQPLISEQSPADYLAPEQIQNQPVSQKTDVYAFAALLYTLLAGVPPFEAASRQQVLDRHLRELPPLLDRRSIPASMAVTIVKALDKLPEGRPFMHKVLNDLTEMTGPHTGRWMRFAAPVAGVVLATAIGAPVGWMLLAPRLAEPVAARAPRVPPTPAPPSIQSSQPVVPAPTTSNGPAPAAPPGSPVKVSRPEPPVATPGASARAPRPEPPATTQSPVEWRPVVVPRPAPAVERSRPRPVPPTESAAARPAPERPAAAPGADEPDPSDAIDWLLSRRGKD
jgi:serine/threonine-protein kinase